MNLNMNTRSVTDMPLMCYGCGDAFDPQRWNPIASRADFWKPSGGLWTSPVAAEYGWKEWSRGNDCGDLSSSFQVDFSGTLALVDCLHDAAALPADTYMPDIYRGQQHPDWDALLAGGIDGLHLTAAGLAATMSIFETPAVHCCFWGWDCETVLIMNADAVRTVSH